MSELAPAVTTLLVSLPTVFPLVIGFLAGVVAALVMDWPMSRQPEGFTPAYIAAGVVTRQPHENVRFGSAMVVHHVAGGLGGILYALLVTIFTPAVPPATVWGINPISHLLAAGVVVGFIYAFFAHFVLPRRGGRSYEEQATAIRGQWLRSALVFGATLIVTVPFITAAFVG